MSFSARRRSKHEITSKRRTSKPLAIEDGPTIHDLPVLRRKRTLAFNRLKKIFDVALLAKSDVVKHLDRFMSHYSTLKKIVESFEESHSDILCVVDDSSVEEKEDEIRSEFDDIYFEIETIHRQLVPSNSQSNRSLENFHDATSIPNVKLPKLQLPTFSGQIKFWPEFYDIFNSLVHNNTSLSDTERMHYLVSSLSGDALGLIRTYPIQGVFYREAYETLTNRYRDKRELAFTCWKEILNINFKPSSPLEFRRVLDLFNENLNILKGLNLPTDKWDFILSYLILSKLDSSTRCAFEQSHSATELPSYQALKSFLYSKCEALVRDSHFTAHDRGSSDKGRVLDKINSSKSNSTVAQNKSMKKTPLVFLSDANRKPSPDNKTQPSPSTSSAPSSTVVKCLFCSGNHSVNLCNKFAQLSVPERIEFVKTNRRCFNCLRPSHTVHDCNSIFKCRLCHHRHHTLLHLDEPSSSQVTSSPNQNVSSNPSSNQVRVLTSLGDSSVVMLSTAHIQVRDYAGNFKSFRALIDSGSQAHFITERALQCLGLEHTPTTHRVRGLGQSSTSVSGTAQLEIGANNQKLFSINALTLSSICGLMPFTRLDKCSWHHVHNLKLADPDCHKPGPIDILLGAEVFASLLLPGRVEGGPNQPSALKSVFGWLLMGNVGYKKESFQSFFINDDELLHHEIKKLWELDHNFSSSHLPPLTSDEERCEQIFVNTHSRDSTGRYIVTLPFKNEAKEGLFPGSRDIAMRCFHSIERRLLRNPVLYEQYNAFMQDYLDSGHMTLVQSENLNTGRYFIPHHCVVRPESTTTKLRVVFNASAKDARGISLNDSLLIGPKLQPNIVAILLNFRIHSVVFMADMRQMYRRILIHEADRDYQRIFWRFTSNQPIQEYRLNTVTYGVSSAPFLACRTIKQLILDEGHDFPLASQVLSSNTYIDDLVVGYESLLKAQQAKDEVISLLHRGNFELRKWASNHPELLSDLPVEHCLTGPVSLDDEDSQTVKVLGLGWDPHSDTFLFSVTPQNKGCTKRNILSELARIFDPLGFLSPLTLVAKALVQRLWLLGIGWDEEPPQDVILFWNRYLEQLPLLESLKVPRFVSTTEIVSCQLHGFSDSSETGYGAVIYLRVIKTDGEVQVSFICSKARVAPTKSTSLPRLELCAAVLLADLLKFVADLYLPVFHCTDVFAWSDSTIVLAWLRSHPSQWKTFIANRVSHIHDVLPNVRWGHVRSDQNPADVASRGQLPSDLVTNSLWWAGPSWLPQSPDCWPRQFDPSDEVILQEHRKNPHVLFTQSDTQASIIDTFLIRYSSIRKIQRLVCWWLKYFDYLRSKRVYRVNLFHTRSELHKALMLIVKHVQSSHFVREIHQLREGQLLQKQMRKLNPFLDSQGILRVGGRLARSGLEFEHKHPALIPRDSKLTYLIIEAFHRENCHPGVNTMQYLLTQQFWILSPKRAIRHCLSKCVQCYKTNPVPLEPFMSDLPAVRVNQVKPFSVVGTDYGGPFRIKLGKHRGAKIGKAYLCLFVCLTTKALHLEAVSDLSSDAFIAALRRFVGRRGRVNIIHSDCGTNYVGASNQLNNFMHSAAQCEHIEFRFNPPASPHFGGVWEIQIKAVKSHLYRIVGDQSLTFEELATLFIQIESMLNSRPLCPLSSDPNDLSVLTPGHFLTLEPLTSVPDEDYRDININRLGRWQLLQRFQQDFWNRWKHEYLQSLTVRAKWTKHSKPLDEGSVVILKQENTMPLHWPLARVEKLHPSPDGIIRIATIRTVDGSRLTRPLAKLCPLPHNSN